MNNRFDKRENVPPPSIEQEHDRPHMTPIRPTTERLLASGIEQEHDRPHMTPVRPTTKRLLARCDRQGDEI
jgi:hypothetical protein